MNNIEWYAVGVNECTGYIAAASCGCYEFVKTMAARYREHGYLSMILTPEEFNEIGAMAATDRHALVVSER